METLIPLILIALGSAALVVGREGRMLLTGLGMQWAGIAWGTFTFSTSGGSALQAAVGEVITALACVAVMWLTLSALDEMLPEAVSGLDSVQVGRLRRAELRARRRRQAQLGAVDQFWPLVIVLAGGMAGFALSRLYPLGGSEGGLLAVYWVALAGILALVIDGARDSVKLDVSLFALLNGAFLLAQTLDLGHASSSVIVALMSACRIALAVVLAYSWSMLKATYNDLDLNPLFDNSRDDEVAEKTETAIVTTEEPGPNE
jgi:ABC-type multidrug transport system fused ATPase/permease subunit